MSLRLTKAALVFKNTLTGLAHRTHRWFAFPRFQIALAAICTASVLLTCLLALAAVSWLQQRDSLAAAESNLDKTLAATGGLINVANMESLCSDVAALGGIQSAFISLRGVVDCTIPPRSDYAAVTNKALEGDIHPYDQFYSVRWSDKVFRIKSIIVNRTTGPLLVTVGEPIWLLADRLSRSLRCL